MKLRFALFAILSLNSVRTPAAVDSDKNNEGPLMSDALDRQVQIVDERIAELNKLTQEKAQQLHRLTQSAGGAHVLWEDGVEKLNAKRQLAKMLKA